MPHARPLAGGAEREPSLPPFEGLAAEHYRRVIAEKTRDALARLRANGQRFSGLAPYGFRFGPGGQLVPDPGEHVALGVMQRLRASGPSLRTVSQKLAGQGKGRPRNWLGAVLLGPCWLG
jgi:DNA invertase Pin-like site-specific DNA recombinase